MRASRVTRQADERDALSQAVATARVVRTRSCRDARLFACSAGSRLVSKSNLSINCSDPGSRPAGTSSLIITSSAHQATTNGPTCTVRVLLQLPSTRVEEALVATSRPSRARGEHATREGATPPFGPPPRAGQRARSARVPRRSHRSVLYTTQPPPHQRGERCR